MRVTYPSYKRAAEGALNAIAEKPAALATTAGPVDKQAVFGAHFSQFVR